MYTGGQGGWLIRVVLRANRQTGDCDIEFYIELGLFG